MINLNIWQANFLHSPQSICEPIDLIIPDRRVVATPQISQENKANITQRNRGGRINNKLKSPKRYSTSSVPEVKSLDEATKTASSLRKSLLVKNTLASPAIKKVVEESNTKSHKVSEKLTPSQKRKSIFPTFSAKKVRKSPSPQNKNKSPIGTPLNRNQGPSTPKSLRRSSAVRRSFSLEDSVNSGPATPGENMDQTNLIL